MSVKVTALAVGQGQGNLVEVYDEDDRLICLALLDCGRTTREPNWDIAPDVIPYIRIKMEERARVEGADCQAFLDMLVISHQDDDHWNLLPAIFPPCREQHYGVSGKDEIEGYIHQPDPNSTVRRYSMYHCPELSKRTYIYSEDLHKNDIELSVAYTTRLNTDEQILIKSLKLEFTQLSHKNNIIIKISGDIYYELSPESKLKYCSIRIGEKRFYTDLDPSSVYPETVHSYILIYNSSGEQCLSGRDTICREDICIAIEGDIQNITKNLLSACGCRTDMIAWVIDILSRVKNMDFATIHNEIIDHREVQSVYSIGEVYLGGAHCYYTEGWKQSYLNAILKVFPLISRSCFHFVGFNGKTMLKNPTDVIFFDLLLCTGGSLRPPVRGSNFSVANFGSAVVSLRVLILDAEEARFLFPGDATVHTIYLLNQRAELLTYYRRGVVMAPHHGSDCTSKGYDFLPSDRCEWPILHKFLTDAAPTGIVCSIGYKNSFKMPGNTFVALSLQALQGEAEMHTLYFYSCGVQGEEDGWHYYETNQPFYTTVEWIAESDQYEFRHHQFTVDGGTVTHRAIEPIELPVPAAAVQTSVQSALPAEQKLHSFQIPLPLPELDFILD